MVALEDMMMDMKTYTRMYEHKPEVKDLDVHEADTHYITSTTHANPPGMHAHDLYLTAEQVKALSNNGTKVNVFTTETNGHQHELELIMDHNRVKLDRLLIVTCDGLTRCWDHHGIRVYKRTP